MAARKRKRAEVDERESETGGGAAGWIGAALLLTAAIIGGFVAWKRWGPEVMERSAYKLAVDNVTLPEQPPWISSDIRAEVFRDSSLTNSSMLERGLTKRVCDAFEMHPWVERVNRVNMQPPARVLVDLNYRQPVAWVRVPDGVIPGKSGGVLPIDKSAVLLPPKGLTDQPPDLLLITIDGISPCGPAGEAWGDPRVAGAAAIAAVLGDQWRDLGVAGISGTVDYSMSSSLPITRYELLSPNGKRIIWGSAPDKDLPNEPDAIQKLHLLEEYVRRNGPIDQGPTLGIDLRDAASVLAPKTAQQAGSEVLPEFAR